MGEVAGMVDGGGVGMGRDGSIEGNVFVLYALAMALVVLGNENWLGDSGRVNECSMNANHICPSILTSSK